MLVYTPLGEGTSVSGPRAMRGRAKRRGRKAGGEVDALGGLEKKVGV